MDSNFSTLSVEGLTAALRERRKQIASLRGEMDEIETALLPKQAQASVKQKLAKLNLTPMEQAALRETVAAGEKE